MTPIEVLKMLKSKIDAAGLNKCNYVIETSDIEAINQALLLYDISGSTLLPDGWKVYKCTDCQEINVKKDNRQITVGYCDNCEHPLWNDDVD